MRAYFFVNSWLSSIQKGIQVAHCVAEISSQSATIACEEMFLEWVQKFKTIIVLEGGSQENLKEIEALIDSINHDYPWAIVYEDEESLNGAATCVGIILPEPIYMLAKSIREKTDSQEIIDRMKQSFASWELQLIDLINAASLAR